MKFKNKGSPKVKFIRNCNSCTKRCGPKHFAILSRDIKREFRKILPLLNVLQATGGRFLLQVCSAMGLFSSNKKKPAPKAAAKPPPPGAVVLAPDAEAARQLDLADG